MVKKIETRARVAMLALLVAISTLTSTGCAFSGDGKNLAYAVDGSAIALGFMLANADNGCDGSTSCELESLPDDILGAIAGTTLMVAGTVGLLVNYAINRNNARESRPMPAGHQLSFQAPSPTTTILTPPGATPPRARLVVQAEVPPECQIPLQVWKVETDHQRRYDLFRRMPKMCRRVAVGSTNTTSDPTK